MPGHKQGRGIDKEFYDFIGPNIFKIDVTIFDMVDGLHHPKSHIKKSPRTYRRNIWCQRKLFHCERHFWWYSGHDLIAIKPGDKILVPRNIHISVSAGIILGGATPVYMQPEIDPVNGIAHGVSPETVKQTLLLHPDTSAVLVINPTYYGIATDLVSIVNIVHGYDIPLLVDEAHGPHLQFADDLPISAMEAGADACTQSTHKLTGALTQAPYCTFRGI